ncbi:hypothetical protein THRCLA_11840 [Thraustotheca clavata]|uniref:Ubiquitin-like domain-containing protein n=1 Tax=Thraustotheca clavata TaxID=74557 RepID=A0A1V9Y6K1_9STRA|nr:hypothetical protein THRCLA_11840 [Thraustotheca clavata]
MTEEVPIVPPETPYKRLLVESDRNMIDTLLKKMQRLDDTYHIWVRDATDSQSQPTKAREPFAMRLRSAMPIAEIRDQIQERYEKAGHFNPLIDPPLRLLYGGKEMIDGKRLIDYLPHRIPPQCQKLSWAKPYSGVIWVSPLEVRAQFAKKFGQYVPFTPPTA